MDVQQLSQALKQDFKDRLQLMSFFDYLELIKKNPVAHLRGSAQYAAEMLSSTAAQVTQSDAKPGVVGLEKVEEQITEIFTAFANLGINNRLILLHGPNGSAKSTLISSFMERLADYSQTPGGALYSFSWIFPVDKIVRGSLGIGNSREKRADQLSSYASLTEDEIACVIPSELHDHPLLLLPEASRREFLKECAFKVPERLYGGLSHRDQLIYQALLNNYHGDYAEVMKHIRVERFYLSKIYRSGLVTIEPQMHVDAHYQQLTQNRSLSQLPASLQGLNLFSVVGDLADSNRGVIDYNDLLKRPIDTYKYLLTACETAKVSVGPTILHLDTVFIGSSNELQLDAFKEYPDFSSFKGRIELIKVPYLLKVSQEAMIYEPLLKSIAGSKPVTPHTAWAVATWAILTRLKKPNPDAYPDEIKSVIAHLTPLDKLKLYDSETIPEKLSNEERMHLKANLENLAREFDQVPFYEGRSGASARELKTILIDAAQNPHFKTLSPLAVVAELKQFVLKTSEYDFLREEAVDHYHDAAYSIEVLLEEYALKVDREVRECLGLYDTRQWAEFMKRYVVTLSAYLRKERMKNPVTGGYAEADEGLLEEFEMIVEAPEDAQALAQSRLNLISQIGAWTLEHPGVSVDYFQVFPELKRKIEKHFYESQKNLLQKMNQALKLFGTDFEEPHSEGGKLARETLSNMQTKFAYSESGAKEVIGFLMNRKY